MCIYTKTLTARLSIIPFTLKNAVLDIMHFLPEISKSMQTSIIHYKLIINRYSFIQRSFLTNVKINL